MVEFSKELEFTKTLSSNLADPAVYKYGKEWPVVYMIYNDDEVYIGETVDASIRMSQHIKNDERRKLKNVVLISDETYNKSVIQDLESFLISHAAADTRFSKLQNGNAGHQKHNYYNKDVYEASFATIWNELIKNYHLAEQEVSKIENSNIFKYSPYKTLTTDQYDIAKGIVYHFADDLKSNTGRSIVVNGEPGTGKTILGIYLMKLLTTRVEDDLDSEDETLIECLKDIHAERHNLKVGIVVSMENLRAILKETFKHVHGLNSGMVLSPGEVARSKEIYDLLIVDEAHRLKAQRNMSAFEIAAMRNNNVALDIDEKEGTQLDWIMKKSNSQIFFYDKNQSIKKTDIDEDRFAEIINDPRNITYNLSTQMRCFAGGEAYIKYIKSVFSNRENKGKKTFNGYDVRIFEDVDEMVKTVRQKDVECDGLCRTVAGFAWDWRTHDKIDPQNLKETEECIAKGMYDIEIDDHKYIWNVHTDGWIGWPNSVNEIGCIHTIQGFDLNYAGVIIGNELKYDPEAKRIYVDKSEYRDANGKKMTSDEELLQYILNIYIVLCTRGIKGTYIYACDDELRKYLSSYFDVVKK